MRFRDYAPIALLILGMVGLIVLLVYLSLSRDCGSYSRHDYDTGFAAERCYAEPKL